MMLEKEEQVKNNTVKQYSFKEGIYISDFDHFMY